MKVSTLIFNVMLFSAAIANAQSYDIGISFNPGISRMTIKEQDNVEDGPSQELKWVFSGNFGMFLYKPISYKSSIGVELLYTIIETKELQTYDRIRFGTAKYIYRSHFTYAALPIFYKLRMERLNLKIGFQTMFLSKSSYNSEFKETQNGITKTTKNNGDIVGISKLDFGPKVGFERQLTSKMALSIQYYHGLKNVGKYKSMRRFNRQATLGLQYSLTKKAPQQ